MNESESSWRMNVSEVSGNATTRDARARLNSLPSIMMMHLGHGVPPHTVSRLSRIHRRFLSSRAAAVLSSLDIPTSGKTAVAGVFNGTWGGSGKPLKSICPSTGEVLAHVSTVSNSESCIAFVNRSEPDRCVISFPGDTRGTNPHDSIVKRSIPDLAGCARA